MKQKMLVLVAMLLAIQCIAQEKRVVAVRTGVDFVFKDIVSKNYFFTNAYAKESKFFNKKNKGIICKSCYIDDDFITIGKSFRDTLMKLMPEKAAFIIEKKIIVYFDLKPTIKGVVIDASVGWACSEKIDLFSESELKQLRKMLFHKFFKVTHVEDYGNTPLCQTITISIVPSLWKE
jgi:hypothetical protein